MLMVSLLNSPFAFAQVDIQKDWCSNIADIQEEIPGGYHRNEDGTCDAVNLDGMPTQQIEEALVIIDLCPNIDEVQEVIPAGYILVDNTDCLPDVCPNIPGAQATIPVNYYIGDGECAQNVDIRFNTKDGITLSTPNSSGKYVYDACPNVWGIQGGVPAGYTKDSLTNKCKKKPVVDMCPNIDGFQKSIPKNYIKLEEGGNCVSKFKI